MTLTSYRVLGRSGLRVSPLCLGAMTFGKEYAWGADADEARRMFDMYVDRGGNFIDTANIYTNGTSERFVGQFAAGKRNQLVIATKYSMTNNTSDANSSGNGRKSMMHSVEGSLNRLNSDYIDLLYIHGWDNRTPVEEVVRGLDDIVRSGKVLYVAVSNTPAWQVSRMQTISYLRGWSPLIAFQMEYSLVERTAEREMIPMALELGLGVMAWSPLGSGVLTGKYSRSDLSGNATMDIGTRKSLALMNGTLSERNLVIADAVREVARETGKTAAQVALAWTLSKPAITAPVMGARTIAQLEDNLDAIEVQLTRDEIERLNAVSTISLGAPHEFLAGPYTQMLLGNSPAATIE